MNRLQGKVALITGASSGIGRASAIIFANEGAKVAVVDINEEAGQETVRMVSGGGEATFIRANVSKVDDVQNAVDETIRQYGRLDVLFNNAGIATGGTILETSEEVWDRTIDINLKGQFLMMKATIPHMIDQGGGSIINTASVNGLVGLPSDAAYDASKGGVVLLTKATALDFGAKNIRVNCICPGTVDSPLTHNALKASGDYEGNLATLIKMNAAFQRLVKPDEVAKLALFLASDDASAITGAAYVVDAGYTAI